MPPTVAGSMTPVAVHSRFICDAISASPGNGAVASPGSCPRYTSCALCGAAQSTTVNSSAHADVNGSMHSLPKRVFHACTPAGWGAVGAATGVSVAVGSADGEAASPPPPPPEMRVPAKKRPASTTSSTRPPATQRSVRTVRLLLPSPPEPDDPEVPVVPGPEPPPPVRGAVAGARDADAAETGAARRGSGRRSRSGRRSGRGRSRDAGRAGADRERAGGPPRIVVGRCRLRAEQRRERVVVVSGGGGRSLAGRGGGRREHRGERVVVGGGRRFDGRIRRRRIGRRGARVQVVAERPSGQRLGLGLELGLGLGLGLDDGLGLGRRVRGEGRGRERQLGLVVGVGVGRDHLVERHVRLGLGLGHAGARLGVLCGRVGRQVPEVSGLGDLAGDRRLGGGLVGLRVVGLATAAEEPARTAARRLGLVDLVVVVVVVVASSPPNARPRASSASSPGRSGGEPAPVRSAGTSPPDPPSRVGREAAGGERGEQVVDGLLGLRLLVGSAVVATGCRGEGRERRTAVRRGLGLGADGLGHGRLGLAAHLDEREVVGVHRRVGNGRALDRARPGGGERGAGCRGRHRRLWRAGRTVEQGAEGIDRVGGERAEPIGGGRGPLGGRGRRRRRGLGRDREDRGRRVGGRRRGGPCGSGRRVARERTPRVGGDLGAGRGARAALVPSGGCRGRGDRMPRRLDRGSGGRGRHGGRLARLDRRGPTPWAPRPARRSARA